MKLYQQLLSAGALIVMSCSSQEEEKKAVAREVLQEVYNHLDHVESQIYLSEGFEFTPGGGYWFYPNGMKNLTEQQRDEISKRLELRTVGLSKLEKKLDEMKEKYR